MDFRKLLAENIYNIICKNGVENLRPPQEAALEQGLFTNNVIVSSPTASGKTLIAEMAILDAVLNKNKKALYLVPLRSLASEKYHDFKNKYNKIMDVSLSMGDLDSSDSYLNNYDLIIATSEKLDSLLRHNIPWLDQIGVLVVDEIHLLNEEKRGPTLEVILTRLKKAIPHLKILGLSATIKNSKELASWLDAKLVESDYRPVTLKEGVMFGGEIDFFDEKIPLDKLHSDSVLNVLQNTHAIGKQSITFVSSRRSAESLATKCRLKLGTGDVLKLKEVSEKILNVLEKPTPQCEKLAKTILFGSAFHHAGLLNEQRHIIEKEFRNGTIKNIFATPTLAMGVDLPAFRVIVRDLKRYDFEEGINNWIKVLEYKQLAGRAGRPKYEQWGEAVTLASSDDEKEFIRKKFIDGEVEEIYSKLSHEPTLRMHMLSLISQNVIKSEQGVMNFFNQTFYAKQYGNLKELQIKIRSVLDELESCQFIQYNGTDITATKLGIRVSQLYLDPYSAQKLLLAIRNSKNSLIEPISILHAICTAIEMKPLLGLSQNDYSELSQNFDFDKELLLFKSPSPYSYEFEEFIRAYKTASLFDAWICEKPEESIMIEYSIKPGDLRSKIANADWLLYSLGELSRIEDNKNMLSQVNSLRIRLKYGIKSELLALIKYSDIGRVRSRILFNAGIKNSKDIRNTPMEVLGRLIGHKTALKLLKQVTSTAENDEVEQSNLNNFP